MSNKILSTLNIGNNSYEIDDAFARQKVEEVNNNLLKINPVYSASGSVVSFDDGADNLPLEELIVDINPVQDLHGYDHPWIGGGGKNLFDKDSITNNKILAWKEGNLVNESGSWTSDFIPIENDTTYFNNYAMSQLIIYDEDKNGLYTWRYGELKALGATGTVKEKGVLVTPSDGKYLRFSCRKVDGITENLNIFQLEKGSTETDYAPYSNICPISGWTEMTVNANGTEIHISWESEAGTIYGGNLNVLTGVLTVTQYGFDGGAVDWVKTESYAYGKFSINTSPLAVYSVNTPTVISSAYKSAANSSASADGSYVWIRSNTATIRQLRVKDDTKDNMTAEEFKVAMSGVQFVYELAEPITYQLTPHEVKTLLGQNNIFTDINSNNILVSYKGNILKYIDKAKSTIFFGQCDPTSTATEFTAQIDGITEYFDGLTILLKNGVVASATGCTININGLGAKSMWASYELARVSTAFNVTRIFVFIYDSALDDGNGGFWMYQGNDTNDNTVGYLLRTNSTSLPVSSVTYRYRILFTSADKTHYVPANNSTSTNATAIRDVNQEKIDPFGKIVYYSSTTVLQAETRPSTAGHWLQNTIQLGYSFNRTGAALTLTPWKPVYVKATPYVDGSAIIDADEPITQDLPTTEDGKIYIHLANAYSATNVELSFNHPIYYYYNGAIRPWLGFTDSEHTQDIVSSVNGKTGTVTLTAEDVGAMEGMTILSYGHSTWAEFEEAFNANRIVYCKASSAANPSTGVQSRMAFLAYIQLKKDGFANEYAEFQYYRSVSAHTNAQQGDQVFCYGLNATNGGEWSVYTRQATSRVIAGTGLASAYTKDKLTLSLDADYKNKIDTLWADYQSRIGQ